MMKKAKKSVEAQAILNRTPWKLSLFATNSYNQTEGNFESNVRDMMIAFNIKREDFGLDAHDFDIIKGSFENLYSTQEKAVALKAVSLYLGNQNLQRWMYL